ncbi:DUF4367 domain-containing protein [Clostridium sp. CX1]|uniref:DUF4367 domain-containing protein n=1 Tax=Clostridium sp. CX1 TaxID=2978346 RepID=UPI0021C105FD|nr:DUF4367 domain-containing protein [Clostridium sp. CX1]MCT8978100.1 DUF4367 domain-containing protein [Clostridium sp. CX1]
MNKDINNLREITDSVLKDIKVTDELKSLTLKKCKEKKEHSTKPIFITAASAAIIAFSIFNYKFILHNPKLNNNVSKELPNKSISLNNIDNDTFPKESKTNDQDTLKSDLAKDEIQSKNKSQQNDYDTIVKNNQREEKLISSNNDNNLTDSSKNESLTRVPETEASRTLPQHNTTNSIPEKSSLDSNIDKTNDIPQSSLLNMDVPSMKVALDSPSPISIADAENFWGDKILMPSYLPNGFQLTDVSIPKDNSKEVYVKLNYSFENTYFRIVQNKSTTYINYVGESIDFNGSKAYVSKTKDSANPNIIITEIKWINNNIEYTITGNLSESELTKILKSIG